MTDFWSDFFGYVLIAASIAIFCVGVCLVSLNFILRGYILTKKSDIPLRKAKYDVGRSSVARSGNLPRDHIRHSGSRLDDTVLNLARQSFEPQRRPTPSPKA